MLLKLNNFLKHKIAKHFKYNLFFFLIASVTQRIECQPSKLKVAGSNPVRGMRRWHNGTAFGCNPDFRGFDSHPPLNNKVVPNERFKYSFVVPNIWLL
tara:strand:+ start:1050 stop:1343 length:294 start_codon:yes stop_codon:yes gene_type:complete